MNGARCCCRPCWVPLFLYALIVLSVLIFVILQCSLSCSQAAWLYLVVYICAIPVCLYLTIDCAALHRWYDLNTRTPVTARDDDDLKRSLRLEYALAAQDGSTVRQTLIRITSDEQFDEYLQRKNGYPFVHIATPLSMLRCSGWSNIGSHHLIGLNPYCPSGASRPEELRIAVGQEASGLLMTTLEYDDGGMSTRTGLRVGKFAGGRTQMKLKDLRKERKRFGYFFVIEHAEVAPEGQVWQDAKTFMGEHLWSLPENNCEMYCNYLLTRKHLSLQLEFGTFAKRWLTLTLHALFKNFTSAVFLELAAVVLIAAAMAVFTNLADEVRPLGSRFVLNLLVVALLFGVAIASAVAQQCVMRRISPRDGRQCVRELPYAVAFNAYAAILIVSAANGVSMAGPCSNDHATGFWTKAVWETLITSAAGCFTNFTLVPVMAALVTTLIRVSEPRFTSAKVDVFIDDQLQEPQLSTRSRPYALPIPLLANRWVVAGIGLVALFGTAALLTVSPQLVYDRCRNATMA